jgi:hypothetical protein
MSDIEARRHLVEAIKIRALFDRAFYKGFQRRDNPGDHEAGRLLGRSAPRFRGDALPIN